MPDWVILLSDLSRTNVFLANCLFS